MYTNSYDTDALMSALMKALSSNTGGQTDVATTAASQAGRTPVMPRTGGSSSMGGGVGSSEDLMVSGNPFYNPNLSTPDYGAGVMDIISRARRAANRGVQGATQAAGNVYSQSPLASGGSGGSSGGMDISSLIPMILSML